MLHVPAELYPSHEGFLGEVLARETAEYLPVFLMRRDPDSVQHGWTGTIVHTVRRRPRIPPLRWLYTYFWIDLRYLVWMPLLALRWKVNVIQVRDMTFPLLYALFLRFFLRCKVVYQKSHPHEYKKIEDARRNIHCQFFPRLYYWSVLLENRMLHWAMRHCDAVLPISHAMAENLQREHRIPGRKLHVFGLGFPFDECARYRRTIRIGRPDRLRLVYVGTLAKEREFEVLLAAFARVRQSRIGLPFRLEFIGGRPSDVQRLERLARALQLASCVVFHGQVPRQEAYARMAAMDAGISWCGRHKRFADASPTKAIEYLSLGLPVLAPRTVLAHGEMARHTGAVVLVEFDEADVAAGYQRLCAEYEEYRKRAWQAYDYMRSNYDYAMLRQRLHALYGALT